MSSTVNRKLVLCVGYSSIDFITYTKKYSTKGSTKYGLKSSWQRSGNASIICTVLRNLDVHCELYTMMSSLDNYRIFMDDLRKCDIKFDNCPKIDEQPPFSVIIQASKNNTRTTVHCNMDFPYVTAEHFTKNITLDNYGWIHFEARCFEETQKMMLAIKEYNAVKLASDKVIVSLDIFDNFNQNFELINLCDYAIVAVRVSKEQGWQSVEEACQALSERFQIRWGLNAVRPNIICTWGDAGVGCLDKNGKFNMLPNCKQTELVDTLGIRHTFEAALIYAIYIQDNDYFDSVKFANRIAGSKITHFGFDHLQHIELMH